MIMNWIIIWKKKEIDNIINDINTWKNSITDRGVKKEMDNVIKLIKNDDSNR